MIDELLTVKSGIRLIPGDDRNPASVDVGQAVVSLGRRAKGVRAALELLCAGGSTEEEVVGQVFDLDGEGAVLGFQVLLRRLTQGGLLARCVRCDGKELFTIEPTGFRPVRLAPVDEGVYRWKMSRFTTLGMDEEAGALVAAHPLAEARVVLREARLTAAFAALSRPSTVEEVEDWAAPLPAEGVRAFYDVLQRTGFLVDSESNEPDELKLWTPEDLSFHRRSRLGYHSRGYGGTYRLDGVIEATPGRRQESELAVNFEAVDLAAIAGADPSLTTVMESRRSLRDHDDARPITAGQLGELLYRTLRVTRRMADEHEDLMMRPVPAGGALHSIDVYPAVRLCEGVEPGLYRYDGDRHGLISVSEGTESVIPLMSTVPLQPGSDTLPQVLLVCSARFGRAMWKYESMAYALILKDLGVIYESLYLVATAMGLAPCAQGGGDARVFSEIAGLDPLVESSVGEFVVGSRVHAGQEATGTDSDFSTNVTR